MAAEKIGRVKSGRSRKEYDVKWDRASRNVYVSWGGWSGVGKANNATQAMDMAEGWLRDK